MTSTDANNNIRCQLGKTKQRISFLSRKIQSAKVTARTLSNKLFWRGINDASENPSRLWLTRAQDDAPWMPLRKSDCYALNNIADACKSKVVIEAGRATADLNKNLVEYNFYHDETMNRQLTSAIWFEKEKKGGNKERLKPVSSSDELVMEHVYKNGLKAVLSGDEKLSSLISEAIPLTDEDTHDVYFAKIPGSLSLRKCPRRSLSSILSLEGSTELHRGYGDYHVDGEEEESLGPVKHLVFVIHGVGEAIWSRDNVKSQGIAKGVEIARTSVNKKLYDGWRTECRKIAVKGRKKLPSPPNRIEFIPIQWSDQIHSTSSTLKNTLISTTLQSIPKLRVVANDMVFDILMYLTPEFCEKVLATVTQRISSFYDRFLSVHNHFTKENGTCSLVGHSLGSVIAWDILSILQDNADLETLKSNSAIKDLSLLRLPIFDGSIPFANDTSKETSGTWGPSLTKKMSMTIPFIPKFTFLLGSPLGMFLTLRGALPLFNKMRLDSVSVSTGDEILGEEYSSSSPFSLPGSVYNIFHSSDPVAYRIEPLLLSPETKREDLPSPPFLVPDKSGMRFHVKAKEIGDNLLNAFSGNFRESLNKKSEKLDYDFALGGHSARVDFQLQPGVVENEYLSALSAHNYYLTNDHLLEFLIQCANEAAV